MTTRCGGVATQPALAGPPRLGGTRLVVDQHRDAVDLGQRLLRLDQAFATPHLGPVGQLDPRGTARASSVVMMIRRDPLGAGSCATVATGSWPFGVLAAGHRDRAVVEQLVGDVDPGRDRRLDRQLPRVEVGPVAEVLEEMGALDER